MKTLFVKLTPKIRNVYACGTNLENWYRMLNSKVNGPDGKTFNPSLLNKTRAPSSRPVDVRSETAEKDYTRQDKGIVKAIRRACGWHTYGKFRRSKHSLNWYRDIVEQYFSK